MACNLFRDMKRGLVLELLYCLTGGGLLLACSFGLSRLQTPDWLSDGELADDPRRSIARWAKVQHWVRWLNNWLIAVIGVLIATAGLVPHGQGWMLLWCVIVVMLLGCIFLAMLDACSSWAGYRKALPEAARRTPGTEQQDSAS